MIRQVEKLSPTIKPFGEQLVVTILKGGALQNMKKKYLINAKLFFGSSTFGANANQNAKVVPAIGAEGSAE